MDMEIEKPLLVYEGGKQNFQLRFQEIWNYRDLLYFLTLRDVQVRYKQAALGVTWAILQPLFTMLIFSVIFGRLAQLPSEGIPYPIYSYVGLLPWQLFSGSISRAGNSLVGNANLITKVYFPRILIPLSAVSACLVDFGISFIILIGLMIFYGFYPDWKIIFLPFFIICALLASFSVGLWLSALNVQYRDVQHAIPFIIQAWMYASPVAYSTTLIPKQGLWRVIYGANPIAGVIQGFRWCLLGGEPPDVLTAISLIIVMFLLLSGLLYFRKMEKTFADVV